MASADQEMKQEEQAATQHEQSAQPSEAPTASTEPAPAAASKPVSTEKPVTQEKKDEIKKPADKREERKQAATEKTPKAHTIALIQQSKHDSTRFYQDYTGLQEAVEGGSSQNDVFTICCIACGERMVQLDACFTCHANTLERHVAAGVLRLYETRLKEQHPAAKNITYDFNSLCQYIDDVVRTRTVFRTSCTRCGGAWHMLSLHLLQSGNMCKVSKLARRNILKPSCWSMFSLLVCVCCEMCFAFYRASTHTIQTQLSDLLVLCWCCPPQKELCLLR